MQNKDLAREVVQESTQKPARELCWLLGTSVRKVDGFALDCFIFLAALVLHR
jgi:hypothetical protein